MGSDRPSDKGGCGRDVRQLLRSSRFLFLRTEGPRSIEITATGLRDQCWR